MSDRVRELIQHHVDRCAAILAILNTGEKTPEEIAREHFDDSLLEGFGSMMAANEVVSHCELLIASGDVIEINENKYAATGTDAFERHIRQLEPDY